MLEELMDDDDEVRKLNLSSRPMREERRRARERERLERGMERCAPRHAVWQSTHPLPALSPPEFDLVDNVVACRERELARNSAVSNSMDNESQDGAGSKARSSSSPEDRDRRSTSELSTSTSYSSESQSPPRSQSSSSSSLRAARWEADRDRDR